MTRCVMMTSGHSVHKRHVWGRVLCLVPPPGFTDVFVVQPLGGDSMRRGVQIMEPPYT